MKKLIRAAREYMRVMTLADMALVKLCVLAAGMILGMTVPQRHRGKAVVGAVCLYAVTFAPVMAKLIGSAQGGE